MINKNSLHRQFRRFHLLSKRIPLLIAANAEGILSKASLQKAQVQLKRLFQTLSPYFGQRRLRRVLGSAALVLGLHTAGNAQVAFTGPISNPFGLSSNTSSFILPKFADMDGDGDLDIMAMQDSSALAYYENTGTATNPQFAAAQWNPFNLAADTSGNYIYFSLGDIDNDGDFDMVAGRDSTGYLYFENIGTAFAANFAPPVLDTLGLDSASGSYYSIPTLVDIDSDGDLDIVSGTYYGAKIIHYVENTGTASNPHFEPRVNNPFGLVMLTDYWLPAFADLDRDGDLDVMAGVDNGNFFFQENVGTASSPLFVAGVNNPFGTQAGLDFLSPTFGDLDGDGDLDLLVGVNGSNFVYYRNETPVGVNDSEHALATHVSIVPNPAHDFTAVQAQFPAREQKAILQLMDLRGSSLHSKEVALLNGRLDYALQLDGLAKGLYLIEIQVGENRIRKKLVLR